MSDPYLGEIRLVGFSFAPQGWATCDGQSMAIAQNDALYNLIGTTYGGDGVNTFNLPDLRSRVPIHQGQGSGLSNYVLGQNGGLEAVTLTVNQIPAHTHSATCTAQGGGSTSPSGNVWANWSDNQYTNQAPNATMAAGAVGSAGGSQPHDNMIPFLVINFIIALQGIYPSQG